MDTIILQDIEATRKFAANFSADLQAGDAVALLGDLGAGKTELTKGITSALGYPGAVTSPTFTLVHEYVGGRLPLFHFDFYRLEREEEVLALGFDEYLDEAGVVLVEWASKFPKLMPKNTRWVTIAPLENGARVISFGRQTL